MNNYLYKNNDSNLCYNLSKIALGYLQENK